MQAVDKNNITPAITTDKDILTNISFQAKSFWKYPQEYMEIWNDELTIAETYVSNNIVFKYVDSDSIIAYYSLVNLAEDFEYKNDILPQGLYLDHMYILPEYINKGIGTIMFQHLRNYCSKANVNTIGILSDPNSMEFYLKMGCKLIKEFPSNIPNRTTPFLRFEVRE
jgi:GNAT superfamily N-acetyltransferase